MPTATATTLVLDPRKLVPVPAAAVALSPDTHRRARRILTEGTPESTLRARRGALRYFWAWAGLALDLVESYPVAPEVVVRFLTDHLEGLPADVDAELISQGIKRPGRHSVATLEARISHLGMAHKAQQLDSPTADPRVVELLKAARKIRARRGGQVQKAAATLDRLNAMLATCDNSPAGIRDRALLLLAFASGGRRRSEVAAAKVEDLHQVDGEYVLTIRHSKADQEGEGMKVPIAGRAATALRGWLEIAAEPLAGGGAIFRRLSKAGRVLGSGLSGRAVAMIVQRRAELAGYDPREFGGHSMRAGFITEGGQRGIPLPEIMALSGHRTVSVAARYYRSGAALHNQAARMAG